MKKYIFKVDEKEDQDIVDILTSIPQPFRGTFIKDALRLGIDKEKDMDINKGLPNLAKPYCRFELVKEGLRHLIKSQSQAAPVQQLHSFDEL